MKSDPGWGCIEKFGENGPDENLDKEFVGDSPVFFAAFFSEKSDFRISLDN